MYITDIEVNDGRKSAFFYFEQVAIKRVYIYPSLKPYISFKSIYWTGIYPMEWNGNAANSFNTISVLNFNGYFDFRCFCLGKNDLYPLPVNGDGTRLKQ